MKQIDIYDLNEDKRYFFIAEVDTPLSLERLDCGFKRERIILKNITVRINGEDYLLNKGEKLRLDLGKQFKQLNLSKKDKISFYARTREVEADLYFDEDERGKFITQIGKCLFFRGKKYYKSRRLNYVRTLGFVSNVRKYITPRAFSGIKNSVISIRNLFKKGK